MTPAAGRRRSTGLLALAVLVALAGCDGRQRLNEWYGARGGLGRGSINGTSVLSKMLKAGGHRVRSWRHLSPSLDEADVIVWLPDEPGKNGVPAPSYETVDWFDTWLRYSDQARTLIVVGRQWEAAPEYWTQAQVAAPLAQQPEYARRLRDARSAQDQRVAHRPDPPECDWFVLEQGGAPITVTTLTGPLAEGVAPAKAALRHWSNLHSNHEGDALLADGQGHPLVEEFVYDASQVDWTNNDSRLILIENAGFLLNGALVNTERRKIAGRLIDHLGPPGLRVVFLEGGANPPIRDTDPNPRPPNGLQLFAIWPIGAVLAQIAALGIVYALACWPIFGVPRRLGRPSLTDFGRHVQALARLLAATRDRSYAVTQLHGYFQTGPAPPQARPTEPTTPPDNNA